ncbi:Homoserine/homoserine lactone efflux protein [Delftia tsuruhatensis]|uniref:LysE family translocator n=1 Tax=Delftia tsuruhatensis TaxID=180282 RepID=UPI001E7BAB7F|nr:LysE family translocator [Delftia tsuruhatensis]CAB5705894.1 Homoserine/homoserine lactone efflux protein [Delftia tsuruhatensis]CAC9693832.1 Homoserine/homoserine lactone efflux protein [Delftia tsuruhatensis]
MLALNDLLVFAGASLLLVLTPGPNMLYLISRSLCQGRQAGVVSLAGVVLGFFVHMLCASLGLTALFMAVPLAFDLLKWAGALYLLYMAWQAVRPQGRSPFEATALPPESPRRLFTMGLVTSILNPKVAIFYLSIFPQFVSPEHGSVLTQSLVLGMVQITTSFSVNLLITLFAARIAAWFAHNPHWLRVQKWVMATVLAGLALRLAAEQRRAV